MKAQKLIEKLLLNGYTLEKIAEKTESSLSSVYRWSHGISEPRRVYLSKLLELTEQAA